MSRLVVFSEGSTRGLFDPLDQVRPGFLLRSGVWTIAQRWCEYLNPDHTAVLVQPEFAEVVREESGWPVLKSASDTADDVWILSGACRPTPRAPWTTLELPTEFLWSDGISSVARISGETWARMKQSDRFDADRIASAAKQEAEYLPIAGITGPWDIIAHLAGQLREDGAHWKSLHREVQPVPVHAGVPLSERGRSFVRVGECVTVHPTAVLDSSDGPIILDDGVVIEPYTQLAGPAYIGAGSILLGGKFAGGTAIGPGCRIAGEWEASVAQGFANKAHAGFFGHGFLGEWVNLGALTTNSDLKNTYGTVRVTRGSGTVDTGLVKVGSFIADHTKTGIGTLIPTGATIGVGANVFGGGLCPKNIPSFSWVGPDGVSEHRFEKMIETARIVVARRRDQLRVESRPETLTAAQESVLRKVFERMASSRTV